MLEGIFGAIFSIAANILYIDMRRKGKRGFSRIVLFWLGIPITWLWLFLVSEGTVVELEEKPDDTEALMAEIRRDRALRGPSQESLPRGEG